MSNPFDYTWWLAARAAGIVGFLALAVVAILGLVSALKLVSPANAARLRPYHERLALTGLACITAHGLFFLADGWLKPGLTGIAIPFTMSYKPFWTGLGIIAFYCLVAFALSFYQRRRIGARRWRSAHRFASAAFILGGIHALMAGSDTRNPVLLGIVIAVLVAVGIMAGARALGHPIRKAPAKKRRSPVAA